MNHGGFAKLLLTLELTFSYRFKVPMETPALDPFALDQLRPFKGHDGGSLLGNLIEIYLDQLPARVEGICNACRDGDAQATFKIAHMLKSTSASLGAYTLQALCQKFEEAGRKENLEDTGHLLPSFLAETSRVRTALLDEKRKLVS